MKRFISQILLLTLVLSCLFLQASCKRQSDEQRSTNQTITEEEIKLKVGYLPISAALPLFVALEHGLFDEQDISVVTVKYQNGALMAEDVISGRLAAACPGPADVYLSREVESPGQFKIYLQTVYTPKNFIYSILVRKNSGIKKLEDLRGKKVGVFPGVTNKLLLEILLRQKFGFRPDVDVRVQGITASLQLDALETGEYDAICPLEPMGTIGTFRHDIEMIDRGPIEREVLNPLYITLHALSTKVMNKNPEQLRKFVAAMEKAVDLIRTNEQVTRTLLPKYTSLTLEQARLTPVGECLKVKEASRVDFQKLVNLLAHEGVLSNPVNVNSLYYDK
jgi:NitT/TauT family transport system substrate-binding protein